MPPTTSVSPAWSLLCWNLTAVHRGDNSQVPVAWPVDRVSSSVNVTALDRDDGMDDRDRHALLYIVVVLLFYSTGIVVAIVMYLKREKAEIEEEKAYEDYAKFRSDPDPDHGARYFHVQRMIAQIDRVEREAAEKRQRESETLDETPAPSARLSITRKSPRCGHRPSSMSSALKILVFGSDSIHSAGIDPAPLLSTSRRTDSWMLKPSRSAGGRLDVCCGSGSTDSPARALTDGLCRTHSCGASTGIALQAGKLDELKRSPRSTTTLQVSTV